MERIDGRINTGAPGSLPRLRQLEGWSTRKSLIPLEGTSISRHYTCIRNFPISGFLSNSCGFGCSGRIKFSLDSSKS